MVELDKKELKDSGKRQEFVTGAVRDLAEGKGRYDLLPTYSLQMLMADSFFYKEVEDMPAESMLEDAIDFALEALNNQSDTGKFALRSASRMLFYMDCIYRFNAKLPKPALPWYPAHGIFRVARVYEKGAIKYAPRNWEKGINLGRFLDSALRHQFQVAEGKDDEDHPAQGAWNLLSFVETKHWIDTGILPLTLNDLPKRVKIQPPGVAEVVETFSK